MKKSTSSILFAILFAIFIFFIFIRPAFADKQGIGVFPPVIKIRTGPGAEISLPIKVKNLEAKEIDAQIILRPFYTDETGTTRLILYKDYTPQNSAILKNVEITENDQIISKVILSPRQEKNLNLNIKIDPNQKEQDFYFSVVFLTSSEGKSDTIYSNIAVGTASHILLAIGKDSDTSIKNFSSSLFTGEGRLKFNAALKNAGKHFITAHPRITIRNIFGKIVETINIKEQNILAGQSRILINSNQTKEIVSKDNYFFGPYTATINPEIQGNNLKISSRLTIIVLPGKATLFTSALVLALITTLIRVRQKRLI